MTHHERKRMERTRREFLGVAGGSLLAARSILDVRPARADQADSGRKDVKVRLAVVGGGFGSSHHWHEHPNCEVTAVSDLMDDRRRVLSRNYKCPNTYDSLEEMLARAADTFDAVAIFTDAPSHTKHAIMCMEAGKHVTSACPVAITLEDCHRIRDTKEKTGLKYMMHESSYYRQPCIAARELFQAGMFGRIGYSEVEYYHPDIGTRTNSLSRWRGEKSWRFGFPPMYYPTHSLGLLVGVTGERIVKVSCLGQQMGNDFPAAGENAYNNPFNNEIAIGLTDKGNICRYVVSWQLENHGERGQWFGDKMSCWMPGAAGQPAAMDKRGERWQAWSVPDYWKTDRLPEAMRHDSGHGGSAAFLSAEFVNALVENREPTVNLYESLAMTVPGIVAHESAVKGGEQLSVPGFDRT